MALEQVIDFDKGMQYQESAAEKEEPKRNYEQKCGFECGTKKEIQYERVIFMLKPLEPIPLFAYKGKTFEDSIVLRNALKEIQHLESGERMVLGIRPHYSDTCIIEKIWTAEDETDNGYLIKITPEEMDIDVDEYRYDVSVQTADGDFYPVIPESSFYVLSSCTHKLGGDG